MFAVNAIKYSMTVGKNIALVDVFIWFDGSAGDFCDGGVVGFGKDDDEIVYGGCSDIF